MLAAGGAAAVTPDRMADLVLYVTVEPCVMCAGALRLLGIAGTGVR